MGYDTMLILMLLLLLAGGVGRRTLSRCGIPRRAACLYLVSLAATAGLELSPSDGVSLAPSCAAAAFLPLVFALTKRANCRVPQLVLPISALLGMLASALPLDPGGSGAMLLSAALSSAAGIAADLPFGLAFSGLFPVFLFTSQSVAEALDSGVMLLELTRGTLACQLAGALAAFAASLIIQSVRTSVRRFSDGRAAE